MSRRPRVRVFQFATGNLGGEMVKRITEHPDLELVGLYCYTPEKVGRDAGEIVGAQPLGVTATDRLDDVLAAKPDVVNFNGVWPDVDLFCTLLENGINVVTTSDWISGHHRNHPHPSGKKPTELIKAACQRGAGEGLEHLVTIEQRDFLTLDFSEADVVLMFLDPDTNVELIPRLEKLKPGARVVSHDFDMKGEIEPDQVIAGFRSEIPDFVNVHDLYLWNAPLRKSP